MAVLISTNPDDEKHLRVNLKLLKQLSNETYFSQKETDALSIIYFKFLNEDDVKRTSMERSQLRAIFHSCFHITDDFLIDRSFMYFDTRATSTVSLEMFIRTLSLLLRGTLEDKMKFCFFVYDINGNGKLERKEIIRLLGNCFITEKAEDAESAVKDSTSIVVRKMDLDGDGSISFDDYRNSVLKQKELLECFGRCLPDRMCAATFMHTFTDKNIRF